MERIHIHSFRGGCGKTLIAINLAKRLSTLHKDKKTVLIETDVFMPNFHSIFRSNTAVTFNDFYEGKMKLFELPQKSGEGFDIILCSPQFNPNDKVFSIDQEFHSSKLRSLLTDIRAMEQDYDYFIVDAPPGWGFIQINSLLITKKIGLVIRGGVSAFHGTLQLIKTVYHGVQTHGQEVGLIWNQIPRHEKINKYLEGWEKIIAKELPYKQSFHIYYDDEVALNVAEGKYFLSGKNSLNENIDNFINNFVDKKNIE